LTPRFGDHFVHGQGRSSPEENDLVRSIVGARTAHVPVLQSSGQELCSRSLRRLYGTAFLLPQQSQACSVSQCSPSPVTRTPIRRAKPRQSAPSRSTFRKKRLSICADALRRRAGPIRKPSPISRRVRSWRSCRSLFATGARTTIGTKPKSRRRRTTCSTTSRCTG